jgi:hypothetical protein
MPQSTLSIDAYYKHFKSLFGGIAVVVGLLPLGAIFGSNAYLFPPLDGESIEKFVIVAAVVFSLAVTFLVYFAKDTSLSKPGFGRVLTLIVLILTAVISLGLHVICHTVFVRNVEIPAKNQTVTVSIGKHRNRNIPNKYKLMSDEDMLRDRGATEDSIRLLFTLQSILVGRSCLYFSYLMTILLFVAFGSFGVLFSALDDCKRAKKTA